MANEGNGRDDLLAREARLRAVHKALKLKQHSPEAAAAMKRIALAEVEAYEAALCAELGMVQR